MFAKLFVMSALSVCLFAQNDGLTARDLFYSSKDLIGKAPASGKPVKRPAATRARRSSGNGDENGVSVEKFGPLGLRYTLLQQLKTGQNEEVLPDSTFRAGDSIRISVMANEPGYLYVIQRGSTGAWNVLFPQPGTPEVNRVEAGRNYEIPGGDGEYFTFDEHAGQEKIYVLLSRAAVRDLDNLILQVQQGHQPGDPETVASGAADRIMQDLRKGSGTRDLVFTQVNDPSPSQAAPGEKAIYVVNKASSEKPDSEIVIDMTLNHR
ncbi:MAG TPA: DUF4384 domain-containing protein [Bryobacteraceae bacterium]|jgi:hypothetical protein|nr:DUF4384 domain-containing protein [Bryobacteraceae bacterium]